MNDKITTVYQEESIQDANSLKLVLWTKYQKNLQNYFSDEKRVNRFLTSVMSDVQRVPKLLECEPHSLVNSYMMMAELNLMPSGVTGEAYVLPYKGKAQFQLGYQGLITLFYRAGIDGIHADIVRENDKISYVNGKITHEVDINSSMAKRGKAVGAYVIVNYDGQEMGKYMNGEDILAHGKKFSQSFSSEYSPWQEKNDPELWMWKKTVLKQAAKLIPKNETINKAIHQDNQESTIAARLEKANSNAGKLKMGNLLNNGDNNEEKEAEQDEARQASSGEESQETESSTQ
jgi:phage RecT family recombinase